jgi:hypothetical protein
VVQRIRSAPSPSVFVLQEDEAVREQVFSLLRKQEKRAQARQQRAAASQQQQQVPKKVTMTSMDDRERRKGGKKEKKVIEVEPSVNRAGGDVIVKVVDNCIVGQVEVSSSDEGGGIRGAEGMRRSPHRSPRPQRGRGSPRLEHTIPEENGTADVSPGGSTRHVPSYSGSLERKSHLNPPSQGPPTKSVSMDNFNARGTAGSGGVHNATGEIDSKELNGHNFSGSSGLNCTPKSGSISSFDEKERGYEHSEGRAGEEKEGEHDSAPSGNIVPIPQLRALMDEERARHKRGSLPEAVLVNELNRPGVVEEREGKDLTEASKTPESPKWIDPAEKERLMQRYNVGPTRSNSRKQADRNSQAVTLARKLYMLDGYRKSEVAEKLAQPTEFGHIVAREYLSLFDFTGLGLCEALRQFLAYFSLTGDSQERERVMQHFSQRYHQCNPHTLPSVDAVHGLSVAILLLNTDLHTDVSFL